MDRAVAASLRIEKCERAFDGLVESGRDRARLSWDQDRAVEAASIAARLARDPVLASRQLMTTRAGVALLFEMWLQLIEALRVEGGWSESDTSRGCWTCSASTRNFAPGGRRSTAPRGATSPPSAWSWHSTRSPGWNGSTTTRWSSSTRSSASGRWRAIRPPLQTWATKLLLRYERDAWKRYRESIKEVQAPAPVEAPTAPTVEAIPSRTAEPSPAPSFEEERRALLAEAAAFLRSANVPPIGPMDFGDEDAWLDELERGSEIAATERTQFGGIATGATAAASKP